MTNAFIADVHLGKLAKALRMLGFDTVYANSFTNPQLLQIAGEQNRTLLSRNKTFKKEPVSFLHIASENTENQLRQVLNHFYLIHQIKPFTRCLVCNGELVMIPKEKVLNELEKNTATYYQDFWRCNHCGKIYWKGSHYERMTQFLQKIIQ